MYMPFILQAPSIKFHDEDKTNQCPDNLIRHWALTKRCAEICMTFAAAGECVCVCVHRHIQRAYA